MDLLLWMGKMYARFVAIAIALIGVRLLAVNIPAREFDWWVWIWILAAGAAGIIGGVLYLFSLDGPMKYRTKGARGLGWVLMLFSAALPSSLTLMTVPLVAVLIPGLFKGPWNKAGDGSEVTFS